MNGSLQAGGYEGTLGEMKAQGLLSDPEPKGPDCYQCNDPTEVGSWIEDDDGDPFHPDCYKEFYHTEDLPDSYVPLPEGEPIMSSHDCWTVIDAVVGTSRRVLLFGLPGTGKTYAATKRSLVANTPVYTITVTEETPAAELRGHFIPKKGEMVWMDGPAIRAWREGARLVINEIDHASADTLSLLFAILDDPEFAELTLPTGESVSPKEGFHVIATMNGEPDDLPVALQDRFPVTIEVTDLNPEALDNLPKDLRESAKNSALQKDNDRRLSVRVWLEYATLREQMGTGLAAQAVFGPRAPEVLMALGLTDMAQELDPNATLRAHVDAPDSGDGSYFEGQIYDVPNIRAHSAEDLLAKIEAYVVPKREAIHYGPKTAQEIFDKMVQEERIPG